jgi:hypothetical protein
LVFDPAGFHYGVKAAIVIMKPLYFEFPRITSMYGFEEILSPEYAAFIMAGAVDGAIRLTDKAWNNSDGELNQYQLGNIFLQNLRTIVESAGGRVTLQPNYSPVSMNWYKTL